MILVFSGKALSGKDSAADYLIANYGWDKKTGFAYNLKEACSKIFSRDLRFFTTQEGKCYNFKKPWVIDLKKLEEIIEWMRITHNVAVDDIDYRSLLGKKLYTPRDILQFVGTEVMRTYVIDYHIDVVINNLSSLDKIVVADVRFENEAAGILNAGGYLIRLDRPLKLRKLCGTVSDTNHPSEVALDGWGKWSYRISNNGKELVSLYKKVDRMISTLGIK